jgi:hypothetical protein
LRAVPALHDKGLHDEALKLTIKALAFKRRADGGT